MRRVIVVAALAFAWFGSSLSAAELLFPQERQAFYSHESIELAVAGLPEGTQAAVELVPTRAGILPLSFDVLGTTGTTTVEVTSGSLAPDVYAVKLDGKEVGKLTISSGVIDSTLLLSQTAPLNELKAGGANFQLGNAFSFGRFNPQQTGPSTNPRGVKTIGMRVFEDAIAANLPTVVYMYWTGYVTHKPFGSMKSWAAADMNAAMRLLSFHTSQRLRRFAPNIVSVGTLDEPGLGWGKTPAGGTASGFPDWDEQAWYEQRGWQFTDNPASRPEADWLKFMTIRCEIMKDCQRQARRDIKTPWPHATFSTDLYAPQAIMDGTDPLNQEVNDIPSSHVFVDWGLDRLGAYSGVRLEKSHDPTSRMAHAMNGQLFGEPVAAPQQIHAYRACMNGMLAAGLTSNWWLNTTAMRPADLAEVNNAAKKIGPVLKETLLTGHDVAVLWSFTELAMREKDITFKEASKQAGEKISLLIAALPENTALQRKEIDINAYNVGGDYKEAVLTAHYALARAGYPAQVIHERTLPYGALRSFKTLVIVGQTTELPDAITEHLKKFTDAGGRIVVDKSTTVKFDNAIVADVDLKGLSYRWSTLFLQDAKSFKTAREASLYQTNHFMDEPVRNAVTPFKAALRQSGSRAWAETDSTELLIEHQRGGEGALVLAINGYEELPEVADDKKYLIYNYASCSPTLTLRVPSLPLSEGPNSKSSPVVFTLEGPNFDRSTELADPSAPITTRFEPGEMKVFFAAPRRPEGITVAATILNGTIVVEAALKRLSMPWPIVVSISDPAGRELYRVSRSTNLVGKYHETLPLGRNAPAGDYTVSVTSVVANLAAEAKVVHRSNVRGPRAISNVRVFDADRLRDFMLTKPEIVVAIAPETPADIVRLLTDRLGLAGFKVSVKPEAEVLRKVAYPRVWNPYAKLIAVSKSKLPAAVKFDKEVSLGLSADGTLTAKSADGQDRTNDWRMPNSRITIVGEGFVDFSGDVEHCYEPGVQLHVNEQRQITVLNAETSEVKTTAEFRARWTKPWTRLTQHVGAYQLPAQLPEAYTTDSHLIVLGSSTSSHVVAVLQASELLPQIADEKYPGPGGALVSLCWSPFAVEKNAIVLASSDVAGLRAGVEALTRLLK